MPHKYSFSFVPLLFAIVLLNASNVMASDSLLYKWVDTDGTITFSPTPPPKSSGLAYERVDTTAKTSVAEVKKPLPAINNQFVPQNNAQLKPQIEKLQPLHSGQKSAQCAELRKRVLSLERLLKTDISAETMDNAVVQMAKYQESYNQSCNRVVMR